MVAKVNAMGAGFGGVTRYCLHDEAVPGEGRPRTSERVAWAEVRNLASGPERAAAQMAATVKAAPELKRLAGVSTAGRKLEKPVYHYSLSWEKHERPGREEMRRAADETLKALGLERHQALIVAHTDKAHPHVHVVVNRVDPETGKAASRGNDRLKLSRWAERWERERGRKGCPARAVNNAKRDRGEFVKDERSLPASRYRRTQMRPTLARGWGGRAEEAYRQARAEELEAVERLYRANWSERFGEERAEVAGVERLAAGDIGDRLRLARIVDSGHWAELRHLQEAPAAGSAEKERAAKLRERERAAVERESRTVLGRLRIWRIEPNWRDLVGAVLGRANVLDSWRRDLARYHPETVRRTAREALAQHHRAERQVLGDWERERGGWAEDAARDAYRAEELVISAEEAERWKREQARERAERWEAERKREAERPRERSRGISFDR